MRFFWSRKGGVLCAFFSGAEKEGEAVCGLQQFFSSSFAAEKKGRQIIQVFFCRREAAR